MPRRAPQCNLTGAVHWHMGALEIVHGVIEVSMFSIGEHGHEEPIRISVDTCVWHMMSQCGAIPALPLEDSPCGSATASRKACSAERRSRATPRATPGVRLAGLGLAHGLHTPL